jgi:uncharacterized membrane protein
MRLLLTVFVVVLLVLLSPVIAFLYWQDERNKTRECSQ